ncbi:MAG: hypothetical protein ABIP97_13955 [Chthoniobacterales bacterium]
MKTFLEFSREIIFLSFVCIFISPLAAEDRTARLIFTPPALEGRFSIGIYTLQGKLVRILFASAPPTYFQIGINGYQISWDGKDDAGQPAPAGKYTARGYVVGDIKVEGEAYHFNDWVSDMKEPIPERIKGIFPAVKNQLLILAKTSGEDSIFEADGISGESHWKSKGPFVESAPVLTPPSFLHSKDVLSSASGEKDTWWAVIARTEVDKQKIVVGQFEKDGTFLRELPAPVGEPPFSKVATSADSNLVWILSEDDNRQILRALRPAAKTDKPLSGGSDWEIAFEHKSERCANFGFVAGKLVPAVENFSSPPINVRLIPNDLEPEVAQSVSLHPLARPNGGWIATADGLPLVRISDAMSSRLALMLGDKPGVGLWYQTQGGAVVEEFRIEGLENMADFNVGEFDLP